MLIKRSFTLTEMLVVLVIIGTLAALFWPNYSAITEKGRDREAKANLALVRAAEKIYRMEQGFYYPNPTDTATTVDSINSYLKLSLSDSAAAFWSVDVNSDSLIATATRIGSGADGRQWTINLSGTNDQPCSGSSACP